MSNMSNGAEATPAGSSADGELAEAMRQMEEGPKGYDVKYGDINEITGLVVDNTENTRRLKTETVTDLKHDVKNWVEKVKEAKESADDVGALTENENEVKQLETEQQDLIQEILAGNSEVDKLKEQRGSLQKRLDKVRGDISEVSSRQTDQIPTYKYLIKAMKMISNVILVDSDRDAIRGFIPNPRQQEVTPFTFESDMEPFERVSKLWDDVYASSQ